VTRHAWGPQKTLSLDCLTWGYVSESVCRCCGLVRRERSEWGKSMRVEYFRLLAAGQKTRVSGEGRRVPPCPESGREP
jgi:hypothetical protein